VECANDWCKELAPIGKELKVVKPGSTNVVQLSKEGKIIGWDGNPLDNGHVDADWKGGLLPFPDYCLTVTPLPMETIVKEVKQRLEYEDRLIREMVEFQLVQDALAGLGFKSGDGSVLHIIKLMRQGEDNISAWFRADSHKKMLTCHLPSTASMPDAVYSPEQIYKLQV
jgi:hypothetical protein